MKVLGQLEGASLEQLSADPGANTQGRIYQNTTEGRTKLDDGVAKRALLRNDEKMILGNDAAPANNVRIHKATSGLIQDVLGDDVTAEGTSATTLAQRSARTENKTDATLPTPGNVGRQVFVTDTKLLAVDDGTVWKKLVPIFSSDDATSGTNAALPLLSSSVVRLTNAALVSIQTIVAGFSAQEVTLVNRTGVSVSIINDSGATPANRILTGTGVDYILANNAAITLKYDSTTSRWQSTVSSATLTPPASAAIATKTANYTITPSDSTILCDATAGSFSITLPNPADVYQQKFIIKRKDVVFANSVAIVGAVDGETDWKLWTLAETLEIHSDGTTYHKVNHITETDWISAGSAIDFYLMTITSGSATAGTTYTNNGNTYTVAKTIGVQEYTFTLSPAASATLGAVYSNNGKQYTVTATISGGTTLVTNGTGVPQASGVLNRVSGTGDLAINFSTSSTVLTVAGLADPAAGTLNKVSGAGDATLTLLSFAGGAQRLTATTTMPVFNPSPVTNFWKWRRSGRHIITWINFYQSAAGVANGVGDYLWPMVPGILIDTAVTPAFTGGAVQTAVGGTAANTPNYFPNMTNGQFSYQGVAYLNTYMVAAYSTTKYRVWGEYNSANALYSPGSTYIPATAVVAYNHQTTLPIKDWKA